MSNRETDSTAILPNQKAVYAFHSKPSYNICFHKDGQEIGKLDFNGPEMVFKGSAEESAKVFFDCLAKTFYGRLEEERKAGQALAQQAAWVGLTDEELLDIADLAYADDLEFAQNIQAKLKEKNCGI